MVHRWVSAKKNQGINEIFQKLGDQLITQPSNVSVPTSQIKVLGISEQYPEREQETGQF